MAGPYMCMNVSEIQLERLSIRQFFILLGLCSSLLDQDLAAKRAPIPTAPPGPQLMNRSQIFVKKQPKPSRPLVGMGVTRSPTRTQPTIGPDNGSMKPEWAVLEHSFVEMWLCYWLIFSVGQIRYMAAQILWMHFRNILCFGLQQFRTLIIRIKITVRFPFFITPSAQGVVFSIRVPNRVREFLKYVFGTF